MPKANRKCTFCGNDYYYCGHCRDDINKPSWYTMWCSEQCKNLDKIIALHRMGKITTNEAQDKIKALNIDTKSLKFARDTLEEYFNKILNYHEVSENAENVDEEIKDINNIEELKNSIENITVDINNDATTTDISTSVNKRATKKNPTKIKPKSRVVKE